MDMELQPVVLEGYRQVLDTAVTQEETLESIVPDTYPDIARIVTLGARLRFAGLVNIIAGRLVMPELLQRDFTPYNTAAEVLAFLRDTPARRDLAAAYAEVRERLGGPDATARAAAAIAAFLRGDALPDGNA